MPSAIRRQDIFPHDWFGTIEHPHGSRMVSAGATQIGKIRQDRRDQPILMHFRCRQGLPEIRLCSISVADAAARQRQI